MNGPRAFEGISKAEGCWEQVAAGEGSAFTMQFSAVRSDDTNGEKLLQKLWHGWPKLFFFARHYDTVGHKFFFNLARARKMTQMSYHLFVFFPFMIPCSTAPRPRARAHTHVQKCNFIRVNLNLPPHIIAP